MRPVRAVPAVLAALLAATLVAGCTTTKETDMTRDEAKARVAEHAQQAVQHLPAGATLKETLTTDQIACDDNRSSVFVESDYDVLFDKGWPVDTSMATLAAWWTGNGYKIVRDSRDSKLSPELVVENTADAFHVAYLVSHQTDGSVTAHLTSSSPCIPK